MSAVRRLFCAPLPEEGGEVCLEPGVARHARVLRLEVGAPVVLFDGAGLEAQGELLEDARVCVGPPSRVERVGARRVLCLCMPKGSKLETIVRGVTELGVAEIRLVHGERSVARPGADRAARKMVRLEKVAAEASRQSGRADVPAIAAPRTLAEVLEGAPEGCARLAFVPGAHRPPESALGSESETWLVVGPEGGLSEAERALLAAAEFVEVGLGPLTLRVETAALIAVGRAQLR